MCGEVGSLRGAVVAMRMCVVMHCAMACWWGCALGALLLRFECEVPLVLLRDCFCVACTCFDVCALDIVTFAGCLTAMLIAVPPRDILSYLACSHCQSDSVQSWMCVQARTAEG